MTSSPGTSEGSRILGCNITFHIKEPVWITDFTGTQTSPAEARRNPQVSPSKQMASLLTTHLAIHNLCVPGVWLLTCDIAFGAHLVHKPGHKAHYTCLSVTLLLVFKP
ncbi:hypothetical protein E2C01_033974 [Portunus trituberculatus]|uniref:Uncharacterized protein n=1 Tax=Portunus trituberculatus TaxID=210409 RepID=A0A5B7F5J9_PORTR|nr:hypothetical protein [Portunus trituberculatus]